MRGSVIRKGELGNESLPMGQYLGELIVQAAIQHWVEMMTAALVAWITARFPRKR